MPELNVKTLVEDFEKKVTQLKKDVDNLTKKKSNLESDIGDLQPKVKDLTAKKSKLDSFLAEESQKVTKVALERVQTLEDGLKVQRDALAKEKGVAVARSKELGDRIKASEKAKANYEESQRKCEAKEKEVNGIKLNLKKAGEMIKGLL